MIEDMEKVAKLAKEYLDLYVEWLDETFPKQAPGHHRPTDQEIVQWVTEASMFSPPMPMVRPDGNPLVASPYLAAVGEAKGGDKALKRAQQIMSPEVQ